MSVLENVRKLVERLAPAPVCDSCIAERLNLPSRQYGNRYARELVGQNHIERCRGICSLCSGEKIVTRRRL
jgi:hypothetical protein